MSRGLLPLLLVLAAAAAALFLFWAPPGDEAASRQPPAGPERSVAGAAPAPGQEAPAPSLDPLQNSRVTLSGGGPLAQARYGPKGLLPAFEGRLVLPGGSPAAGAEVTAHGRFGWSVSIDPGDPRGRPEVAWTTTADRSGAFAFPEAPRDGLRFVIRARKTPFAPLELVNLPATPGRTRDLGTLRLQAGFELSGSVRDAQGRPVPDARVVPVAEPAQPGLTRWVKDRLAPLEGREAVTGADGAYRLVALPPGRVRLEAQAPGFAPVRSPGAEGRDGEQIEGLDLILEVARPLAGRVVGPDGLPVAGARLRLEAAAGERIDGVSGADGSFRLDAHPGPGRLDLRVAAAGFAPHRQTVRDAQREERLEIRLQRLAPLTGFVEDPGGLPLAGVAVGLFEARMIEGRAGDPAAVRPVMRTESRADGTFQLVPDLGRTWDRRFVVAAWDSEHAPGLSGPLVFEAGARPFETIRLVLDRGFEVSGTVLSPEARPLAGARVYLRRIHPAARAGRRVLVPGTRRPGTLYRQGSTGTQGSFRFTGVPAGEYRIEAHHPGYSPAEGEEFPLLQDHPHTEVQLSWPSRVEGQVAGRLDLFRRLRVTAERPQSDPLDAPVDARGAFFFEALSPGTYRFVVREVDPSLAGRVFTNGQGEGLARREGVEVTPGDTVPVTLEIDLAGRALLQGSVRVNGRLSSEVDLYLVSRSPGAGNEDPRLSVRALLSGIRSAATDFQGAYRFAGVDPGDYWLVAERAGSVPRQVFRFDASAGQIPSGLAAWEVRLDPGVETSLPVEIEVGTVEGRGLRADGKQGVPGGSGLLRPEGLRPGVAERPLSLRGRGRFREGWVPAGRWTLTLRAGGRSASVPVEVAPGATATVEAVLAEPDNEPQPIQ